MKYKMLVLLFSGLSIATSSVGYAQSQSNISSDGNTQIQGNDNVVIENLTINGLNKIVNELRAAGKSDDFIEIMKTERLAYEQIAKDPVIQSIYAPILDKGLFQKYRNGSYFFDYPKAPSLQELREMGVVGELEVFVFWTSGTDKFDKQDRPTWGGLVNSEGGFVSEEAEKEYIKRYELFTKLVDIWVKDGLLQP